MTVSRKLLQRRRWRTLDEMLGDIKRPKEKTVSLQPRGYKSSPLFSNQQQQLLRGGYSRFLVARTKISLLQVRASSVFGTKTRKLCSTVRLLGCSLRTIDYRLHTVYYTEVYRKNGPQSLEPPPPATSLSSRVEEATAQSL